MSAVEDNESFDLRLLWLLLIPGILVGAVLTRVFFVHVDDGATSAATSNLTVTVPAQVGRCAVPSADQLSQQSTAVEADVTAVNATTAQLRVSRVLAGAQVGEITVQLPAAGTTELNVPTFVVGDTYLLAVSADGSLAGCGLSGKSTGDLQSLYTKAFG
ncbi:hypothetical protein P5P86_04750 [Nocardioides sp. BP30]|uniref:hypothetical protein n=1 Tax=Nocardioides sp. BP30 TaxID=3036374 RepID=UPI00246967FB|nr:hypothetical protein [Nocardioides sp. BP30]WGL53133.1 hypothetical protein P5P86_04750 [Nocardioides sp. BP30]